MPGQAEGPVSRPKPVTMVFQTLTGSVGGFGSFDARCGGDVEQFQGWQGFATVVSACYRGWGTQGGSLTTDTPVGGSGRVDARIGMTDRKRKWCADRHQRRCSGHG